MVFAGNMGLAFSLVRLFGIWIGLNKQASLKSLNLDSRTNNVAVEKRNSLPKCLFDENSEDFV